MQAWTSQERGFSDRPGYQRIRLEPGRYKGLDAAVWEFTQLEGGQLTHKLDVTFKSADGRSGYALRPVRARVRADRVSRVVKSPPRR
jgi:hypothetical protein